MRKRFKNAKRGYLIGVCIEPTFRLQVTDPCRESPRMMWGLRRLYLAPRVIFLRRWSAAAEIKFCNFADDASTSQHRTALLSSSWQSLEAAWISTTALFAADAHAGETAQRADSHCGGTATDRRAVILQRFPFASISISVAWCRMISF